MGTPYFYCYIWFSDLFHVLHLIFIPCEKLIRAGLFLSFHTLFALGKSVLFVLRLTSYALECITSPMDSMIKPFIDFLRLQPAIKSLLTVLVGAAVVSVFVIAGLMAIGSITLPAGLVF